LDSSALLSFDEVISQLDEPADSITKALSALSDNAYGGTFACRSNLSTDTLKISVDGVGDLRLPLSGTQAKSLAKVARPAPYGSCKKSLRDASVRDVGEIDILHRRLLKEHAEQHALESYSARREYTETESGQLVLMLKAGRMINEKKRFWSSIRSLAN